MQIRFDDPTIRNLKPREKSYDCKSDKELGFGIRVQPTGTMTFFFQYKVDGKRRFMVLGDHPYPKTTLKLARDLYQAELARVKALRRGSSDGIDPVFEKKRRKELRIAENDASDQAFTVKELCQEYVEKHAKRFKRSWSEDERILNKEVIPLWGNRKAADIVKRDIVLLLEKIIERGSPGMSNNTFQVVRKMFNFAVERDILPYSPANGVKALAPKIVKDRALSADEIKTFWANLDKAAMSDGIKNALKLILFTAQRPGEVIGIHTSEIDGNWWTIPSDRAKNGKTHRVYLTPTARGIIEKSIEEVRAARDIPADQKYEGYIFPCPHLKKVKSVDVHAVAIAVNRNIAWQLVDQKGKPLLTRDGKPATENKLGVEKFTPHDLRRTTATFISEMGFMDEIIDAILNHVKQGVIRVYNQNKYDNEKQKALEAWERKLNGIINETQNNVIFIDTAKRIAS